ncbi:MAG: MotA/TolQ/ExbB proton channel family protein [Gammaproteobacteria bacterium]|nr:MotA/TolQ/ExbB proton channel family protein [Gammaproteobacteria bacterium]
MSRLCGLVAVIFLSGAAGAWTSPDFSAIRDARQDRDNNRTAQQRQRLETARMQLATTSKRVGHDDTRYRSLQTELAELAATRDRRLASLGAQQGAVRELFTTARQTAGDLINIVRRSPTQPPQPLLEQELTRLATSSRALDLGALAGLWETLHLTLTDTATQARQELAVQIAPGELALQEVTKIGTVMAVAGDRAVVYDRVASHYRALTGTDRHYRGLATAPASSGNIAIAPFKPFGVIDHENAVLESLREAGPVGALIIALGILGLTVLVLRALLIQRILTNEKLAGVNSGEMRLQQQLEVHRSENSASLAGWLSTCVRRERRRTRWGHTLLSVIIGVAPLLGLLGTVTGMIVTFHSLRLYGGGDPVLMADGIGQALSTTLLGLSVAIPLLIGQRWLLGRATRHIQHLNARVLALIAMRDT